MIVKEYIIIFFLFFCYIGFVKGFWIFDLEIKNFIIYVDGFMNIIMMYLIICYGSV